MKLLLVIFSLSTLGSVYLAAAFHFQGWDTFNLVMASLWFTGAIYLCIHGEEPDE